MITKRDLAILEHVKQNGFVTIEQCYKLFFSNAKYGRDMARKELKKLVDIKVLNKTIVKHHVTAENIYYKGKAPSPHSILLMDYYSNLVYYGCKVEKFIKNKDVDDEIKLRPDALVEYEYKDMIIYDFIEVVFSHRVDFKKYEELKQKGTVQKELGVFPRIIIIGNQRYKGDILTVKTLDFSMLDFQNVVLP